MKKYYAESELIINPDGSIFHLHIKPEQLANKIILVGGYSDLFFGYNEKQRIPSFY